VQALDDHRASSVSPLQVIWTAKLSTPLDLEKESNHTMIRTSLDLSAIETSALEQGASQRLHALQSINQAHGNTRVIENAQFSNILSNQEFSIVPSLVRSWSYILDTFGQHNTIRNLQSDLLVLNHSVDLSFPNTLAQELINSGPQGSRIVAGYVDVAELDANLPYWNQAWDANRDGRPDQGAPDWLANANGAYSSLYTVNYWTDSWKVILFDQINKTIAKGFNAIFLDVLGGDSQHRAGNYFGNAVNPQATADMSKLIKDINYYIKVTLNRPDIVIIGNNPIDTFIEYPSTADSLDIVVLEAIYWVQNPTNGSIFGPGPNDYRDRIADIFASFVNRGGTLLSADYVPQSVHNTTYLNTGIDYNLDYFEWAMSRDFVGTLTHPHQSARAIADFPNFVFGRGENDVINGTSGARRDYLSGGAGNDTLSGLGGDDVLAGGSGLDRLFGGDGNDRLTGGTSDDLIDGGSGTDTAVFTSTFASVTIANEAGQIIVNGTEGRDTLRGIEVLQFADGIVDVDANGQAAAETRRTLTGTAGADTLTGGGSRDVLSGGAGNDILRGGGNNDALDGGTGFDAALYSGVRRQYVASSTSVSGNGEGTDTLTGIEEARFVDGVLTFDASSASAQVMRLYSATLNRTPDQGGLEANTGALATLGLQGLANTFVASAEFQARFGALNNQQFVEQLYVFALGRIGDAPGIASWVALLNGGASRGQVVVGFSESAENIGRTAATLNAGLWVPDPQALIIARLYDATFKRLPDVGGLTGWVNALKGGASVTDIAAAFAGSAEFQATFGALSNQAFVEQLYRFCLNREGDAGGIAGWVNALNTGTSRASVLLGFSESAEHVALTANLWLGGIRFAGFVGAPAEDAAKDMDGPQILPDVEDIDIAYDPADLGLSFPDKDADAFVLPAVPDMPLPTVDPAAVFDGLDLAVLRAEAFNNSRMMLILPEAPDATPDFDLDAWAPAQRDGYWLM